MRHAIYIGSLTAVLGLAIVAIVGGGCGVSSSVAAGRIGERTVLASAGGYDGVKICSREDSADFTVGGRVVHVTASQVSWEPANVLPLPAEWSRLELHQSGRETVILLDGKRFGVIGAS